MDNSVTLLVELEELISVIRDTDPDGIRKVLAMVNKTLAEPVVDLVA